MIDFRGLKIDPRQVRMDSRRFDNRQTNFGSMLTRALVIVRLESYKAAVINIRQSNYSRTKEKGKNE